MSAGVAFFEPQFMS